jgi:hypothetical protein
MDIFLFFKKGKTVSVRDVKIKDVPRLNESQDDLEVRAPIKIGQLGILSLVQIILLKFSPPRADKAYISQ